MTLLFFVNYTNDITADMTSGPPPIPIKTFEDVITFGYRIIVWTNEDEDFFSNASPGTARARIYETSFDNLHNISAYPSLSYLEILLDNPQALMFTDRLHLIPRDVDYKADLDVVEAQYLQYFRYLLTQIMFLQVDGAPSTFSSLALQNQSELLGPFNYFLMKQNEHGISARLFRKYHMALYIKEKFGLIEPQPLGHKDVMSLFILLGLGMLFSLAFACVEMLRRKKYRTQGYAKKKRVSQMQQRRETIGIVVIE